MSLYTTPSIKYQFSEKFSQELTTFFSSNYITLSSAPGIEYLSSFFSKNNNFLETYFTLKSKGEKFKISEHDLKELIEYSTNKINSLNNDETFIQYLLSNISKYNIVNNSSTLENMFKNINKNTLNSLDKNFLDLTSYIFKISKTCYFTETSFAAILKKSNLNYFHEEKNAFYYLLENDNLNISSFGRENFLYCIKNSNLAYSLTNDKNKLKFIQHCKIFEIDLEEVLKDQQILLKEKHKSISFENLEFKNTQIMLETLENLKQENQELKNKLDLILEKITEKPKLKKII